MSGKRAHGEGTFYARPTGGWLYRVTMDGRRIAGSGRTKVEAKRKALEHAKVAGASSEAKEVTFSILLERWTKLGAAEVGLRPATFDQYRSLLASRIEPALGTKRLDRITAREVGAVFDAMTGAQSTRRSSYAALVRVLDHAVDRALLSRNVARDVRRPRAVEAAERGCTPKQARLILDAARGHHYGVAAWLSYACGLRRGEMLALRWSDLDLEAGRLAVTGNVTRTSAGLLRGATKNKRGQRIVPLGPEVVEALKDHRKAQAEERLAAQVWQDPDLVLANEAGGIVEPRALSRVFVEWAKAAGVEDTGTHLGRHFAATLMLSSGRASVADVAAVMGHDPAVLLATYASAASEGQQAAAEALGSVLGEQTS